MQDEQQKPPDPRPPEKSEKPEPEKTDKPEPPITDYASL